jgi:nucleoid DNA-binding protein
MNLTRYHEAIAAGLRAVGKKPRDRRQCVLLTEQEAHELAAQTLTAIAVQLVDAVFEQLAIHASTGTVQTRIGVFRFSTRAARRVINFQRKAVRIPARRQLTFSAAKRFRGLE